MTVCLIAIAVRGPTTYLNSVRVPNDETSTGGSRQEHPIVSRKPLQRRDAARRR